MISAVLSIVIVNIAYKLYAKLIGADVMFFSGKKKLAAYVVLWALLFATTGIYSTAAEFSSPQLS